MLSEDGALISVIVPIYNIERYLGICLESMINQTYKNLEIILVDDGSSDRCPEICDLYARKDKRIKVIHKQNGGLVTARKEGLLRANGDYIGYVDGDDWVGPGFYEALYSVIKNYNGDVAAAGMSRDLFNKSECFSNNMPSGLYEGDKLQKFYTEMISYGAFYRPGVTTYVWNKLFKREILNEHQLKVDDRISIGEDAAVVYPALLSCEKICLVDNYAYHYRQREDSMLKKTSHFQEEKGKLKILYDYLSDFVQKEPKEYRLQEQIDDFVLSVCIMRSGGMTSDLNRKQHKKFFPFGKDFRDKNIVIYSAGTFGQQLVNRIKENIHCNIVGWIDHDYWEYRRCCLDVDPVESIAKTDFDFVLLATVDSGLAQEMKKDLFDCGVSPSKILSVICPAESKSEILKDFFD